MVSLLMAAAPVAAQTLPSGQVVTLHEVLADETPGALWLRFRFVAPQIAGAAAIASDVALQDMEALCIRDALPYVAERALKPARIVISLADRVVPFGATDPGATQYFELFSLRDGRCIWEAF